MNRRVTIELYNRTKYGHGGYGHGGRLPLMFDFDINACRTIYDFKHEIEKKYNIPKNDFVVSIDGRYLSDDDACTEHMFLDNSVHLIDKEKRVRPHERIQSLRTDQDPRTIGLSDISINESSTIFSLKEKVAHDHNIQLHRVNVTINGEPIHDATLLSSIRAGTNIIINITPYIFTKLN